MRLITTMNLCPFMVRCVRWSIAPAGAAVGELARAERATVGVRSPLGKAEARDASITEDGGLQRTQGGSLALRLLGLSCLGRYGFRSAEGCRRSVVATPEGSKSVTGARGRSQNPLPGRQRGPVLADYRAGGGDHGRFALASDL